MEVKLGDAGNRLFKLTGKNTGLFTFVIEKIIAKTTIGEVGEILDDLIFDEEEEGT